MSLRSASFLNEDLNRSLQFNGGPGWRQISAGLRLAVAGYCVLMAGSAVAAACVGLALTRPGVAGATDDANPFPALAATALALTALCSYGLVLAGQWRCLMYAPQRNSAKELIYVCFHCLLLGSVLNAIGAWLDGGRTYAALQQGWAGLQELDPWSVGNLMQAGSILLGVVGSLVFSQFLRNVAECFDDRRAARAVDFNLWFMGLLIGGSIGAQVCIGRLTLRWETLPWLVGGWLLCFAWHLWLVARVRRCVDDGLRLAAEPPGSGLIVHQGHAVLSYTLSGLHRLARGAGV